MCLHALLPVQDILSNIFHYKYVNGACVLHALLSVTGQVEQVSKLLPIFKQEIVVFYMLCIWDKRQVSIPAVPLTFDLLVGDQDKFILIYVSICSHLRPGRWQLPSPVLCVNVCLHSRLLRSHLVHWSIFMLAQLLGYCFC